MERLASDLNLKAFFARRNGLGLSLSQSKRILRCPQLPLIRGLALDHKVFRASGCPRRGWGYYRGWGRRGHRGWFGRTETPAPASLRALSRGYEPLSLLWSYESSWTVEAMWSWGTLPPSSRRCPRSLPALSLVAGRLRGHRRRTRAYQSPPCLSVCLNVCLNI